MVTLMRPVSCNSDSSTLSSAFEVTCGGGGGGGGQDTGKKWASQVALSFLGYFMIM